MRMLSVRKIQAKVESRTAEIAVGGTYFLSSFHDQEGAMVRVLGKSTATNSAGWNSSVSVKVLEYVGDGPSSAYYAVGKTITVNASNLYERREQANHQYKSIRAASDFLKKSVRAGELHHFGRRGQ